MSPAYHIFMFRSIIDLRNESRNAHIIQEIEGRTRLTVSYDKLRRAFFALTVDPEFTSSSSEIESNEVIECSTENWEVPLSIGSKEGQTDAQPVELNSSDSEKMSASYQENAFHEYFNGSDGEADNIKFDIDTDRISLPPISDVQSGASETGD